jgi:CBS domain-containing membrane protein
MTAPHPVRLGPLALPGWLAAIVGATLSIALAGALARAAGGTAGLPWLIAPMGASAVLVFMLPASPLAQPWPLIGGNLIAAAIGLVAHQLVPQPVLAAALAVGFAILAMRLTQSLHPPAGGTALLTALATPAVQAAGWHFLLWPVALNVLAMAGVGWAWNRLTGHSWPHRMAPAPPVPAPMIRAEHIDAVFDNWDEDIDIDRADLHALVLEIERRARGG